MKEPQSESEKVFILLTAFGDGEVTAEELATACHNVGLEPVITPSQYKEHLFQHKMDIQVEGIFYKVAELLKDLKFPRDYMLDEERKIIEDKNEEIEIELAKVVEDGGLQQRFIKSRIETVAGMFKQAVESAGVRITNKMSDALRHMTYVMFGSDFNSLHAKKYMEDAYKKAEENNAQKEKLSTDEKDVA